jgi:TonB family protein
VTLLLDVAFSATVLFAAGWLTTIALRSVSAAVRRTIWRAVFAGVAALPVLLSFDAPGAAPAFVAVAAMPTAVTAASEAVAGVPWLTLIWALGCAFVIGRLTVGLVQVRRWGRAALSGGTADFSPAITVPMTWGVVRPQILLPADACGWSEDARDLVVRHEAAHVASHDWAWQTMARIVTAVLWFHPLAWLADRQLRREAERAADDAVIASGANPAHYADQLVSVARSMSVAPAAAIAAVEMVEPSSLEHRVCHVLDRSAARGPANRVVRAVVAVLIAGLSVSVAAIQEGPIYDVEVVGLKKPTVLKEVRPQYPEEAKKAGVQGEVTLETVVEKDGVPSEIRVIQPLEGSLDRASIEALAEWRFVPARLKDEPVRVIVQIQFRFTIK